MRHAMFVLLIGALGAGLARGQAPAADAELALALELERELVALVARVRPTYVMIGGGSGVVISPDGYMLTNHHVVGTEKVFQVLLPSLRRFRAQLVATDRTGDLALLKLEGASDLPWLPIGDSNALRVGQRVIAIGNPWMAGRQDAQPTVSLGIVSAVHVLRGNYTDAIQTDAPINPGNSGGPLINLAGELVGINGQVLVRFDTDRVNTGIGFAISSHQIQQFLGAMKQAAGGDVPHGTLAGAAISGAYFDGDGAHIERVAAGSPAARAGLQPGDRILELGGLPVWSPGRLLGILGTVPAGRALLARVRRGQEVVELELPVTGRAVSAPPAAQQAFLGIQLDASHTGPGVRVEHVVAGGPADKSGLRGGDVILAVDGEPMRGPEELIASVGRRKPGDKLKLKVQRDLDEVDLEVVLERRAGR